MVRPRCICVNSTLGEFINYSYDKMSVSPPEDCPCPQPIAWVEFCHRFYPPPSFQVFFMPQTLRPHRWGWTLLLVHKRSTPKVPKITLGCPKFRHRPVSTAFCSIRFRSKFSKNWSGRNISYLRWTLQFILTQRVISSIDHHQVMANGEGRSEENKMRVRQIWHPHLFALREVPFLVLIPPPL